jgi:hypothetical protein
VGVTKRADNERYQDNFTGTGEEEEAMRPDEDEEYDIDDAEVDSAEEESDSGKKESGNEEGNTRATVPSGLAQTIHLVRYRFVTISYA